MNPASTALQGAEKLSRKLAALAQRLEGELQQDSLSRTIYATDASEYQERPLAVALPTTAADVRELVQFAAAERIGLIPRAAGTSLAGQVVGSGIVVDAGRHLNQIVSLDVAARRVRVQPGVVRNALNAFLAPHGLYFGPETSTASWAMIGGMVGNNSCGSNSIAYGSTRDHLVSARGFLADGSEVIFSPLSPQEFAEKCAGPENLETRIYRGLRDLLGDPQARETIRTSFPRPEVTRRNTGYALDALMEADCFEPGCGQPLNICRLLAGSEGTLFFGVEFELGLEPLPAPGALLCIHCTTVAEALEATLVVMRHRGGTGLPVGSALTACELIDDKILGATRGNREHSANRSFVVGEPGAVLVVEVRHPERDLLTAALNQIAGEVRAAGLGYAFPQLVAAEAQKVWELRRAGQGLVNNIPGDSKPREIIEDTAVAVEDLPAYIADVDRLLAEKHGIECIHYAHAGAGELHLRPLFDLHSPEGLKKFRSVATDVAGLVKKYRGSLSGEHGDGRLRGEFIRSMVGDRCYGMLAEVKRLFDPQGIFNPGKIINAPPMDSSLRILPATEAHALAPLETVFDFSATQGILGAAEKCTGVGQCRKLSAMGGTMCPSYMATRNEQDTTRARANVLRQSLSQAPESLAGGGNPWIRPELAEVMELCLSCKGCKSECPSNVDMARLKAEWQQHWHDAHGVPVRTRLIAGAASALEWASLLPRMHTLLLGFPGVEQVAKKCLGIAPGRSLPRLPGTTLKRFMARRRPRWKAGAAPNGTVHLFADEFTNTLDSDVGRLAVDLLERLGYEVVIPRHLSSGRAQISKGLLREAQKLASGNVQLLDGVITDDAPLVGLEPSALLGFRDEVPDLVPRELQPAARRLAGRSLLIDEFLAREAAAGRIGPAAFTSDTKTIQLHGHCHQKALASQEPTVQMLSLPANYAVEVIPSGCCGMAGFFGYEQEHFKLSMQIGELVLFPAVRSAAPDTLLAAPGTSCRHQIKDGTGRRALHPVEILHGALLPQP